MKNPLADIIRDARKWAAEKHSRYLEGLTPEQLGVMAERQAEMTPLEEVQEEAKRFTYPKEGRNWVKYCMANRLCYEGFTPDEADLMANVAVNPEETTPEQRKQAAELQRRRAERNIQDHG
jgi:hypothetical protein